MNFEKEARQEDSLAEKLGIEARVEPIESEKDLLPINTEGQDTLEVVDVMKEYNIREVEDIADKTGMPMDKVGEKVRELEERGFLEQLEAVR